MVNKTEKKCGIYKRHFLYAQIKVCRFEIIDGVKYVYCIKHAYKFLLREQVGFAAVLWRLRQCVSVWRMESPHNNSNQAYNYVFVKPLYYVWTTVKLLCLSLFASISRVCTSLPIQSGNTPLHLLSLHNITRGIPGGMSYPSRQMRWHLLPSLNSSVQW